MLAGLLAGLAFEIKYNGLSALVMMAIYGIVYRRVKITALAIGMGVLTIVAWESSLAMKYGQSSFLLAMQTPWFRHEHHWEELCLGLLTLAAGLLPFWGLIGFMTHRKGQWIVGPIGCIMAILMGGYLLGYCSSNTAMIPMGLLVWFGIGIGIWPLIGRGIGSWKPQNNCEHDKINAFLLLWFLAEIALYFKISPFAADRRIMPMCIVLTLVIARTVSIHMDRQTHRKTATGLLYALVICNAIWGGFFFVIDRQYAMAVREGIAYLAREIRSKEPDARIWMLGVWSAKYYMQQSGMRELLPDESRLTAGEWVIIPRSGIQTLHVVLDQEHFDYKGLLIRNASIPLTTLASYFSGTPIARRTSPTFALDLYLVRSPLLIRSLCQDMELRFLAQSRIGKLSGPQVLALLDMAREGIKPQHASEQTIASDKALAERAILSVDIKTIAWGLNHPDASSRVFCLELLGKRGQDLSPIREQIQTLATGDPDQHVRKAAEILLATHG